MMKKMFYFSCFLITSCVSQPAFHQQVYFDKNNLESTTQDHAQEVAAKMISPITHFHTPH